MNPSKRYLIVRTDKIGDVVLSLPMASIIKKHYPESMVSILLRSYTKSLAENCSAIDEVVVLKEKMGKESIRENVLLLKNKFDVCIVAFPTFRIALILWLAGIKIRIGSGYRIYSFLFNKKVYEHRKNGERHEAEHNIRLLRQIGINEEIKEEDADFSLHADEDSKEAVKEFFRIKKIDLSKKIVIVHPGSGGSAIDLPAEKMKKLIEEISRFENTVLIITGSRNEEELCNSMVVNYEVINTAGMFDLKQLTALIDYSDLLIANSTGPIHIGAALGKKVIGFYPKFNAVKPERWGPYTVKRRIFQPKICDGICSKERCIQLNCMNSIEIKEVVEAVREVLRDGIIGS